jgi:uncharacterized glyoxalase superfamily protein PhnB
MSETRDRSRFTPEGWHTLTPRIVVGNVPQLVEFLKDVFGATGDYRQDVPTVITIGDSRIMLSETGIRQTTTAFLYVYVENADETYRRGLAAGAISVEEPADMSYGDRRGMVEDPWGNVWQIATYVKR